jgi:hypothetical protein
MNRKIRPSVFHKAIRELELDIKYQIDGTTTCCHAISNALRPKDAPSWQMVNLYDTPEYKLFKKMFCNKRSPLSYWFGCPWYDHSQKKRLAALKKAYTAAKAIQKRSRRK